VSKSKAQQARDAAEAANADRERLERTGGLEGDPIHELIGTPTERPYDEAVAPGEPSADDVVAEGSFGPSVTTDDPSPTAGDSPTGPATGPGVTTEE
jgi:hypothetical protein